MTDTFQIAEVERFLSESLSTGTRECVRLAGAKLAEKIEVRTGRGVRCSEIEEDGRLLVAVEWEQDGRILGHRLQEPHADVVSQASLFGTLEMVSLWVDAVAASLFGEVPA